MQRIGSLAACRELGGLAACSSGLYPWKKGPTCGKEPAAHRRWAGVCVRPARPFTAEHAAQGRRLCRRRVVFAGQNHRLFCSQPPRTTESRPAISVVGIPDPITWFRCKFTMYLVELFFELDLNSAEFHSGVKQVNELQHNHTSLIQDQSVTAGRQVSMSGGGLDYLLDLDVNKKKLN